MHAGMPGKSYNYGVTKKGSAKNKRSQWFFEEKL
jgi:hypothetical protein